MYGIRSTAFPDVTVGISDIVAVVIEGEDRRDAFPVESIFWTLFLTSASEELRDCKLDKTFAPSLSAYTPPP